MFPIFLTLLSVSVCSAFPDCTAVPDCSPFPDCTAVPIKTFTECPQAGRNKYLKLQHHWLLLAMTEHTGNSPTPDKDPLVTPLNSLTFPVDSQVTLAYRGTGANQVLLQEVFSTVQGQPLVFTPLLAWCPGQVLPPKLKRDDYGGVSISAVTVASGSRFW